MKKTLNFSIFLVLLLAIFTGQEAIAQKSAKPQFFGEKIKTKGAASVDEVLVQLAKADSVKTKITGTVTAVCQMKGCWMNIVSDATGKEIFVQFKDDGFFMPKDISGREVIMDGYAYRDVTSVEELRHYAEDDGKSKEEIEAITEPKEELKFMANGVLLLPVASDKK